MFDDVGSKIKGFAVIVCWLGIICSCIVGFTTMSEGAKLNEYSSYGYGGSGGSALIALGFVILIVGSALSYLVSLFAYGFGEMIENSNSIDSRILGIEGKLEGFTSEKKIGSTSEDKTGSTSENRSDINRASSTQYVFKSIDNEKEELIKVLSECDTAEAMLERIKEGYPSYPNVITVLKNYAKKEQFHGRSFRAEAISEVKIVLGLSTSTPKTALGQEHSEAVVRPIHLENDPEHIKCPNCGLVQMSNRKVCFRCGTYFDFR